MLTLLLGCFPEIKPPADLPDNPYVDYDGDGYSVSELDCDDDNADVWPGAVESCDGVDEDCDAQVDEDCDGLPDDTGDTDDPGPTAEFVGWPTAITATEAADWTLNVAALRVVMGDIDGDQRADLVLGEPSQGRVLVFLADQLVGTGTLDPSGAHMVLSGDLDFGAAVALVDATGNGQPELVVGQPETDQGPGRVWYVPEGTLQDGGQAVVSEVASVEIVGDLLHGQLGFQVGRMDVDDSQLDEVVLVERRAGSDQNGAVYVLEALDVAAATGTRALSSFATRTITGAPGSQLGFSLDTCDVDADGRMDIWAGSPDLGGAWLFTGDTLNPGETIGSGNEAWQLFGYSDGVGQDLSCGDVDGDDKDDLLLLATSKNRAYVVLSDHIGETLDLQNGDADSTLEGSPTFARGGVLADIDGDGRADAITGGPTGAVQLRLARDRDGVAWTAVTSFTQMGLDTLDLAAGDIDGDGLNDLVITDPDNTVTYVMFTPSQ